ncbi:uncharacterized protein PpBr36_06761 [Pyricularia pennisetigena]|uniref:uncharacterized protein n=1 Tax=Pyricularia pennisetigena TaxID=1578925 RepID=UPI00114DAC0F|nr:uncharacterized protein PpBr36_06761 [Pyricularia pennisetigena]TLS22687.1 hypothetical protein PpBr36_06761 [Pyricularia pennisetigena]
MASSTKFTLETCTTALTPATPKGAIILHAVSGSGVWGKGIASEIGAILPAANIEYTAFCDKNKSSSDEAYPARDGVTGRALLIPPQAQDAGQGAPEVYVACLFTSYGSGVADADRGKPPLDVRDVILAQTRQALRDLRLQLDDLAGGGGGGGKRSVGSSVGTAGLATPPVIYSPRFNSGAFHVPWEQTAALVEEAFAGWNGKWYVFERLR